MQHRWFRLAFSLMAILMIPTAVFAQTAPTQHADAAKAQQAAVRLNSPHTLHATDTLTYVFTYIVTTMDGAKTVKTEQFRQTVTRVDDSLVFPMEANLTYGETTDNMPPSVRVDAPGISGIKAYVDTPFVGTKISSTAYRYTNGMKVRVMFQRNVYAGPATAHPRKIAQMHLGGSAFIPKDTPIEFGEIPIPGSSQTLRNL
jgi:hypothetical protein